MQCEAAVQLLLIKQPHYHVSLEAHVSDLTKAKVLARWRASQAGHVV